MPIIKKPSDHFNAVLYTGVNPSAASVTTGFEPGIVWIKSRTQTYSHYVYNSVLGGGRWLYSNSAAVEDTSGDAITFSSTGFTTTASAGATNEAGQGADNLISWAWKTAGSNTTNTNGTVTSIVRANQTAGVSVVTYTGPGSGGGTVGHGLGVAPKMIIIKNRSAAESWRVGHAFMNGGSSPWNYYMNLNGTGSQTLESSIWNNTAPSSTVFTIANDAGVSGSGNNLLAYCFAEVDGFSRFGSYTGNGSTNGPFVYTGFKPRYLMVKRTSGSVYAWCVWDSARDTYNVQEKIQTVNTNNVQNTGTLYVDFLSNGFKLRSYTNGSENESGQSYIFMAFAESPLKYANAR